LETGKNITSKSFERFKIGSKIGLKVVLKKQLILRFTFIF